MMFRIGETFLTFGFGYEWDKDEFKNFEYRKTPLGWSLNIWRMHISFDDHKKVGKKINK